MEAIKSASLRLSKAEIRDLTGYSQPARQLAELQRQGFHRARINCLGHLVLERAHFEAVCSGSTGKAPSEKHRGEPKLASER